MSRCCSPVTYNPAGGVVRLDVSGTLAVYGALSSDAKETSRHSSGSTGGSVLVYCKRLEGTGAVTAAGDYAKTSGAGGRVAMYAQWHVVLASVPLLASPLVACPCAAFLLLHRSYVAETSTFTGTVAANGAGGGRTADRPGTVYLSIPGQTIPPVIDIPAGAVFKHLVFPTPEWTEDTAVAVDSVNVGHGAVLDLKHSIVIAGSCNISDAATLQAEPVSNTYPVSLTAGGGVFLGVGATLLGENRPLAVSAGHMALRSSSRVQGWTLEVVTPAAIDLREESVALTAASLLHVSASALSVGQLTTVSVTDMSTGTMEMEISGQLLVRGSLTAAVFDLQVDSLVMDMGSSLVSAVGFGGSEATLTASNGGAYGGYAFGNPLSPCVRALVCGGCGHSRVVLCVCMCVWLGAVCRYGSVLEPTDVGAKSTHGAGGGAIRIRASTCNLLSGSVTADAQPPGKNWITGSGGSIWLQCDVLSGAATITATSPSSSEAAGSGGRIAMYVTEEPLRVWVAVTSLTSWAQSPNAAVTVMTWRDSRAPSLQRVARAPGRTFPLRAPCTCVEVNPRLNCWS